jgi:hypothetical protein
MALAIFLKSDLESHSLEVITLENPDRVNAKEELLSSMEDIADNYDFAITLLSDKDFKQESHDWDQVLEAGFFIGSLGADRSFIVSNISKTLLPSHIRDIAIQFMGDLGDQNAPNWIDEGARISELLLQRISSKGPSPHHAQIPLLSYTELLYRERVNRIGGDLKEAAAVLVVDKAPSLDEAAALQIGSNILEMGIRYHYFLLLSEESIDKFLRGLQVALVARHAPQDSLMSISEYSRRAELIALYQDEILQDLKALSKSQMLRITMTAIPPTFGFRVHNANYPDDAAMYAHFLENGYLQWVTGKEASTAWSMIPDFVNTASSSIFTALTSPVYQLSTEQSGLMLTWISRAVNRYFKGIEQEVIQVLL